MGMMVSPYALAAAGGGGVASYATNESLAEQSTTGASLTGASITTTLAASTDYLFFWSQDVQTSTNVSAAKSQLTVAGASIFTTQPAELPKEITSPVDYLAQGGFFRYQEGGSPASTAFVLTAERGSAATLKLRNSRLSYLKLGASDVYAESIARQTWADPTNKTAQNAGTLGFTPGSAGDYTILASFLIDETNSSNIHYGVELTDGTTTTGERLLRPANASNGDRVPVLLILPLTGISGAKTITLKVRQTGSGTTTIGVSEIRLVAIRNDRFANVYSTVLGSDNTGTNTTYTTALSQTFTPAAADHLTMAAAIVGESAGNQSLYGDFDDGGTVVDELIREPQSFDNTQGAPLISHRLAAYAASSRTQAIQRKTETSATVRVQQKAAAIVTFDLSGL